MAQTRTIAVVGSNNALGSRVVAALRNDPEVEAVLAVAEDDVTAPDLKRRFEGAAALVDCGWFQQPALHPAAIRGVLDAAGAAGLQHIVRVSSATVYGAWAENPVPIADDAPLRPNPAFAHAVEHAEVERLVAEWRDAHAGVTAAVLRPAVVVGGDAPTPLSKALAAVRGIEGTDAIRPRQFLHIDDLVTAVLVALRARVDGPCNVAPDGWVPDDTARELAGGTARVRLPGRSAAVVRRLSRWLRGREPFPGIDPYVRHPWVVANDRLRAEGWTPEHTNEEAFVLTEPPPLFEVNPRRRQELVLGGVAVTAGGAIAAVVALFRRRGR